MAVSRWRGHRRTADAWRRRGAPPGQVPEPGPEQVVLVDALRELPAQQRRTLTLHYLCDLTVEQIAHEAGLSPSTVKTHLARGRTALARHLRDVHFEEGPVVRHPGPLAVPVPAGRAGRRAPGPARSGGVRRRARPADAPAPLAVAVASLCLVVGTGGAAALTLLPQAPAPAPPAVVPSPAPPVPLPQDRSPSQGPTEGPSPGWTSPPPTTDGSTPPDAPTTRPPTPTRTTPGAA
ncbi:RNA polymerase sigma factor [Actinomadura keratinilytica]